jgi:hypothetical protein
MASVYPRPRARLARLSWVIALCATPLCPALANNYGESASWQFAGPQDLAAQTAARDLVERRRSGVFAAPIYNTNIARQYNCSVSATAVGNDGAQSALANSPTTTGATSTATGNNSSSTITGDGSDATIADGQSNSGAVGSTLNGATTTHVIGAASQSLNSSQSNSGNQSANTSGANACAFGVLN